MTPQLISDMVVHAEHQVRMTQAERGWRAEIAARNSLRPAASTTLRLRIGAAFVGLGERLQGGRPAVAGRLDQAAP